VGHSTAGTTPATAPANWPGGRPRRSRTRSSTAVGSGPRRPAHATARAQKHPAPARTPSPGYPVVVRTHPATEPTDPLPLEPRTRFLRICAINLRDENHRFHIPDIFNKLGTTCANLQPKLCDATCFSPIVSCIAMGRLDGHPRCLRSFSWRVDHRHPQKHLVRRTEPCLANQCHREERTPGRDGEPN
jgi:hypothetical protein